MNCDVEDLGLLLLNDVEIIAEVQHSPKGDRDSEDEMISNGRMEIMNHLCVSHKACLIVTVRIMWFLWTDIFKFRDEMHGKG